MATNRKSNVRHGRAVRRRRAAAVQMCVLGLALALAPLFLPVTVWTSLAKSIAPFGWAFFGIGLLFWWFSRSPKDAPDVASSDEPIVGSHPTKKSMRKREPDVLRSGAVVSALPGEPALENTPRQRPSEWSRDVFLQIEWRRFEAVIEALFAQAGFETKAQTHGADGGVDVWLYAKGKPNEPVSIVQCKQWTGKSVGVDKIRELRGVMASHNLSRGQFATTSGFTSDAVTFAKANGVNLLDVDALVALIERRSHEQRYALLAVALEGDYWRPTCVNCGTKMVERAKRDGSGFWGCANFPKCRTTMQVRSSDRLSADVSVRAA